MIQNIAIICELQTLRQQKILLTERESQLIRPMLTDPEYIPLIYEWFGEILRDTYIAPKEQSLEQRKKYLFIILFLYAPDTLAGGRMPNGIRKALQAVFPFVKPCTISNNCENVMFLYQRYKEFGTEVDYIYAQVLQRLVAHGVIDRREYATEINPLSNK